MTEGKRRDGRNREGKEGRGALEERRKGEKEVW